MWNTNNVNEQVNVLLNQYPQITIAKADPNKIRLSGTININRTACNFTLQKDYQIEILLPIVKAELPKVKSIDGAIAKTYPHRYNDGTLCLETDATVKFRFINGFNIIEWMDEFVETYFFSYEYYSRFGSFPFGERSHGIEGIIEAYQDAFHEEDIYKTYCLLSYVADNMYAGHISCPCGSGLRLRKCHGTYLFPYMADMQKKKIIQEDVSIMRKEMRYIESQRRN